MSLKELQEALDKFPIEEWKITSHSTVSYEESQKVIDWFTDFRNKFAVYCASLEVPIGEWLSKHAKTTKAIVSGYADDKNPAHSKWVSVSEVSALFSANQQSIRKLVASLEKNENQYEEAKDDYDIRDEMISHLNGKIAESRAIRIQLEKVFDETYGSTEK